jgi:endonuclease III
MVKVNRIEELFSAQMPQPETELKHANPYELMVAVILSAQCTDKRVNIITPTFYKTFPDLNILSKASFEDVFQHIKSCSYPNNKARHLIGMAKMVVENYHGKIPADLHELQKLPGVGRKTANVIASVAFRIPAMPVDTHVFRVSQRIGLVSASKTPTEVEKKLLEIIPDDKLHAFHHWLILHGRYVCQARKPKCHQCTITEECDYFMKNLT